MIYTVKIHNKYYDIDSMNLKILGLSNVCHETHLPYSNIDCKYFLDNLILYLDKVRDIIIIWYGGYYYRLGYSNEGFLSINSIAIPYTRNDRNWGIIRAIYFKDDILVLDFYELLLRVSYRGIIDVYDSYVMCVNGVKRTKSSVKKEVLLGV